MILSTQIAQARALADALNKGPCDRWPQAPRCMDIRKHSHDLDHRKMCDSCAAYWLVTQATLRLQDKARHEKAIAAEKGEAT